MTRVLKNLILAFLVAVPFVSIVVMDSLFFPFITAKAFYFRIIVGILLGLYILLIISDRSYRPKKTPLLISIGAFLLVMFFADIFAPDPFKAVWSNFERMEGFVALLHFGIYFIVASSVLKTKEEWNTIFLSFMSVATYLSCFGFVQLAGEFVINQGGVRLDATLGNSAYFGSYLMCNIFILLYVFYQRGFSVSGLAESGASGLIAFSIYYLSYISNPQFQSGPVGKWIAFLGFTFAVFLLYVRFSKKSYAHIVSMIWYGALGVSMSVLLYFTATRGAILGFIGGLIITSLVVALREKESRLLRRVSISLLALIIFIVGLFVLFKDTKFVQDSPVLNRFASISWNENKTQSRGYIWPMAIEGFKERPILGWGQEGFIYVFSKYYNPKMWRHEAWFDRVHNGFLEWLVAGGILGFLSFISIYISLVYLLFKSHLKVVSKAILLGLISGYAFQSLFIFDNLVGYMIFFTILAFVEHQYKNDHHKSEVDNKKNTLSGYHFFGAGLATLLFIYIINIPPYLQNVTLLKALQPQQKGILENLKFFEKALSYEHLGNTEVSEHLARTTVAVVAEPAIPPEIKQKFVSQSIQSFDKITKNNPLDSKTLLFFGSFLVDLGINDLGLDVIKKAEKLSPKKQLIYLQEIVTHLKMGNFDEAYNVSNFVYNLDPEYLEAKYFLAITGFLSKNHAHALKIVEELSMIPENIDGRVTQVMSEEGLSAEGIRLMKDRITRNPKDVRAYLILASFFRYQKNLSEARNVVNQMLKANPESEAEAKDALEKLK